MATHEDVGSGYDAGASGHERQGRAPAPRVDSASDDRTANNAVRHAYRVLSDAEKAQMMAIKDKGAEFLTLVDQIEARTAAMPGSREIEIARQKIEEAVMWAVKHITA